MKKDITTYITKSLGDAQPCLHHRGESTIGVAINKGGRSSGVRLDYGQ
ncbi:MAG: hypothetical protein KA239_10780 [Bacteroidia bacterium]|nr:hypothetical protein [Bacteroidia bacterium]